MTKQIGPLITSDWIKLTNPTVKYWFSIVRITVHVNEYVFEILYILVFDKPSVHALYFNWNCDIK